MTKHYDFIYFFQLIAYFNFQALKKVCENPLACYGYF